MESEDGEQVNVDEEAMDVIDDVEADEGEEDDSSGYEDADDSDEEEGGVTVLGESEGKLSKKQKLKKLKGDSGKKDGESSKKEKKKKAYLPGMQMKEGETLVCDESAYVTLHTFTTSAPCLSFDIIPDALGPSRSQFPLTSYLVAGTQAQRSHANNLIVMKLSNVYKTQPKSSDDELSSDESDVDDAMAAEDAMTKKPDLNAALVPHHGCVNRLRFAFLGEKPYVATWSELGKVSIFDITVPLKALDNLEHLQEYIKNKDKPKPVFVFKGHRGEGFAIDWSPTMPGVMATGDTTKFIHIWRPHESTWVVDQRPFSDHTASVEDIQWSPNEQHVFASCSVDKSIRIWDARSKPGKGSMLTRANAHEKDVNVIHWNRKDPFLASGGDDCALKVWDLRTFSSQQGATEPASTGPDPVAEFKHHHKGPVCSVEWSPHESSVLASVGEDDQVAIWDLALERDQELEGEAGKDEDNIPPQLLFVHQGQQDIKEIHWHTQIPGTLFTTSATGFNVFRPANL